MYSATGAQAYILDSVIESFNERVSEYVNLLWSNLTYELKSYKETKDGDVSAKFSETIVMGHKTISVGSLSGGEFRALSLCIDFALVDVMERQFGLSISPVILDEPFDGLDGVGREVIIELLETISGKRQVVVIDHASEAKAMFSKVISVELRNEISAVSANF
jgi:DNA repair exonuclease SbcCD ATPase subunit